MKFSKQKGFLPLVILSVIALSLIAGYIGANLNKNKTFGGNYNVSGGGTYRLKSTVAPTDSTIHLSSFKEPISNIPYTMAYLNTDTSYGTLDPQQPTRSEFIAFTGITQNSDGSADLTSVTRGLARTPGSGGCTTASTTLESAHAGQSIFVLSDSPCAVSQYVAKTNNELIPGLWTASSTNPWKYDQAWGETASSTSVKFTYDSWVQNNFLDIYNNQTIGTGIKTFTLSPIVPTPTLATQAANKSYVDGVALVSAPNADTTTKGVVEEATSAEINAGTATGGTGARLYVNPSQFNFASATVQMISTTTAQNLSTSTLYGIPQGRRVEVMIYVASTTDSNSLSLWFNDKVGGFGGTAYESYEPIITGTNTTNLSSNYAGVGFSQIDAPSNVCVKGCKLYLHFTVFNATSTMKIGTGDFHYATSTVGGSQSNFGFSWSTTTTAIQSISIGHTGTAPLTGPGANYIGAGSYMAAYAIDP